MEQQNNIMDELKKKSETNELLGFFRLALTYIQDHPIYPGVQDEIENVLSNYTLMLQCYKKGIKDDRKIEIYDQIVAFKRKTYLNIEMSNCILAHSHLIAAKKRGDKIDLLQVRDKVEASRGTVDLELYNDIFSALLVSWQWDEKLQDYYISFILDASTDRKLAALMLSALMLSCLCVFDYYKFSTLVHVYLQAVEPMLKERALVGWAFASCNCSYADGEDMEELLGALFKKDQVMRDLVELQKQVLFCMDAEKDSKTVDHDIMSNVPIGHFNDIVKDDLGDSSLHEILHPEQEEEKAEKLEQSVKRMMQMEKAGSDIYFGGFSQMKNFAFFHRLSNWFLPFFVENPALAPIKQSLDGETKFLETIEQKSPFCESDKYSFSFAVDFSLKATLAPVKSLIKHGDLFAAGMKIRDDVDKYFLARRMYLQDLLRFFKVSSFKGGFANPFDGKKDSVGYFLGTWDFDTMEDAQNLQSAKLKICKFLLKRKAYTLLPQFFPNGSLANAKEEKEDMFIRGLYELYGAKNVVKAVLMLGMVEMGERESVNVAKALAKCFVKTGMYDEARGQYEKLLKLSPSPEYQYKLAFCLLKLHRTDEAMKILYELNYNQPDNLDVIRSMAWAHLLQGDADKALELYHKLKDKLDNTAQSMTGEDFYNQGLCHWVKGEIQQACDSFGQYIELDGIKESGAFIEKAEADSDLLLDQNVYAQDLFMIRDILFYSNK